MLSFVLFLLPSFSWDRQHAATPPGPYVVTDLGTFGGASAQARDVNDAGQVVGIADSPTSGGRPFIWQNGVMTDLGTLGGNTGNAQAINASGQVAGYSTVAPNQPHATLWDHGVITDLTPGVSGSNATGINDARQVVFNVNTWNAFLWDNGTITDLGGLGSIGLTHVSAINNARQAVGSSYTDDPTPNGPMQHAFLWEDGVMTDLGLLPGDEDSGAAAINDLGQIVGSTGRTDPDTYETFSRAFLYENGVMRALPVPSTEASAGDINESGVVVGSMRAGGGFSNYHAWIHTDGVTYNLNSLIPPDSGLHLAWANAIDNAGRIVGVAFDARGGYHAFLLTPATEPPPPTMSISIGDASIAEGRSGTRAMNFTVTLSAASSQALTVTYSTANGTALGGIDYVARAGTLTFSPGETTKTISINVIGDRQKESDEYFYVKLTSNSSGTLTDYQGTGTILNDDGR